MKRRASMFLVGWLLLSFLLLIITSGLGVFTTPANPKIFQFAILNSIMLTGIGIFFLIFYDKLKIYFENYSREKEI